MGPLLEVTNLKVHYFIKNGILKAVNGVSFQIDRNESMCLVGESGCGKSTVAFSVLGMLDENAKIVEGQILFEKEDLRRLSRRQFAKSVWGKKVFVIFQDPMTSLNPVMRVKEQIEEALLKKEAGSLSRKQLMEREIQLLHEVEINDPRTVLEQFPHQLSGGMKQRVMIALGICLDPDLLILDEPTTALDSTVQFKIVELVRRLKMDHGMSQLVVTHNFGVAAKLCDKIAVMYAGKIVEIGKYVTLLREPLHPYTKGLFKCIIDTEQRADSLETISGSVPSLFMLPQGCYFVNRCKSASAICMEREPKLLDIGNEHLVACHNLAG